MKKIFLWMCIVGILASCGHIKRKDASEPVEVETCVVEEPVDYVSSGDSYSGQTIQVLSAVVKDKVIPGAEVILQKNGEQSIVGRTDSYGQVRLDTPFPDDANAMIIIKKDGYSTLVAKCPCQGLTYAISPVMSNLDGIRIVLTWGSTPADLDSHLFYSDYHVYYSAKQSPDAQLDVDDTDGYGPETITIENKVFGREYYYAVQDYTHRQDPRSYALSNSHATVFVYIGQSLVKTYYVPQNKQGNLWTVFKITDGGEIRDINNFTEVIIDDPVNLHYNSSESVAVVEALPVSKENALESNRLGTKAYQEKEYRMAIQYYTDAIEQDPNFGQAYGNLGLVYQKSGMYAEALWANRKAIALANGASAATTRAGAYYNIGRMYEERNEYAKALEQYRMAKSEKENSVYDNAIQRMEEKLP